MNVIKKSTDSWNTRATLKVRGRSYVIFRLDRLTKAGVPDPARLPISLRIVLENLLRFEDGRQVKPSDIEALARWDPQGKSRQEIAFTPARVLLQDFTGVPAVVDFAAMRDAIKKLGGDPKVINPLQPADLVIDHSVEVDSFGSPDSFRQNAARELERNRERYQFLRWGQQTFRDFRVVPPDTGIVHQVNLEYLAQVVFEKKEGDDVYAYPDTVIGTDSHTTMVNGLGVLGWGVGGIEAEAAMLGQPISMLIPDVMGFKLTGSLPEGSTATDLVLAITEILRKKGVVGKFVEFHGSGLDSLSLPDRATIANMCPEYGATVGLFPVDDKTLSYLRLTGRSEELVGRVEAYAKEQGLFRSASAPRLLFSDTIELDLGTVEPSMAGPKRPQDRVPLKKAKESFHKELSEMTRGARANSEINRVSEWVDEGGSAESMSGIGVTHEADRKTQLQNGAVVIAAITSCTNTSNPAVMVGAGLLAKKAVERGLRVKPWVKTSLAPGSKVVMDYLKETKLIGALEQLRFHLVGFGCTTCIGNSGPLPDWVEEAVREQNLVVVSVLSGNRNFEGRIHPLVRANYLASPPLVVAYAIAGTMNVDLVKEPLGKDPSGIPVYLRDIWPTQKEVDQAMRSVTSKMFLAQYDNVFDGDEDWKSIEVPSGDIFEWDPESTYVRRPPFFESMPLDPEPLEDIHGARVLAMLGDSVTTDHISPAGAIAEDSPAGAYLIQRGVRPKGFNSYGARRGNYEVLMRGTFANIRLRNLLVPGREGGWTKHFPDGRQMTIFDAAMEYKRESVPLIVIAGKEYGAGSSRDWAAKGPALLGVRAVIAESFERIHRSNLIGMGILPLQFEEGESGCSLSLSGDEVFEVSGIEDGLEPNKAIRVTAKRKDGDKRFRAIARIDTPAELAYYQHGGILKYVLRQLLP
ncbi:MAG: aconitate hydratase 1 [Omnitrophica bacterium RIFCSPLOWO2_12_FULL_50_11]|nr:MAG: aconitate hydratase 1 [Omnitrophica bacterium RIFCSPLOWO2_12_FULL_50_11]